MLDKIAAPDTLTVIMTAFGHTSQLTERCAIARMLPCVVGYRAEGYCADKCSVDRCSPEQCWGASLPQTDSINLEGAT